MLKYIFLSLLLFCVYFGWGQSSSEREAINGQKFFEIKELFSDERFPNVVVTQKGTVLAIWGRENVRVRRSEDGGQTWSAEIDIASGLHGGGAIVDEESGHILVFIESEHPPAKAMMYVSVDDGKTWKQEDLNIKANSLGHIPSMHMNEAGITLQFGKHKGRIIKPCRYYGEGNDRQYWDDHYTNAMYSDDNGKTWQTSEPFPANGTGEATLVELSNGMIYYNSRRHKSTDGRNPRMRHTAWSDDGGHTWKNLSVSDVLPDGDKWQDYGLMAGLTRLPSETEDVLLFSNIISDKGRHNGHVWVSPDGGQTWPYKKLIDAGKFAYSSMTVGREGTASEGIIYLFYEGEKSGRMARFNMEWLMED